MWFFYVMAMCPILIGAVLWVKSHSVVWWEWALNSVIALVVSAGFHGALISSMVSDVETWSGQVVKVDFYPEWIEEYQQMHTRTVGSGKDQRTEVYFTTEHRTHHEDWTASISYGSARDENEISQEEYRQMSKQLGDKTIVTQPYKGGFDGGDPNHYEVKNTTKIVIPAHRTFWFENRVKAAPSVFSYQTVPDKSPVFAYPKVRDWRHSDRLLGIATLAVPNVEWDRLNSRLGPTKKVNLILVGFDSADSQLGQLQEAKWVGGKKNDLVLTYGEAQGKVRWAYCFGWTESELVKRNLETLLLKRKAGMEFISQVEAEVRRNYQIKDWSKFDYISIEPPMWSYFVLLAVMLATQGGVWAFALLNDLNKGERR